MTSHLHCVVPQANTCCLPRVGASWLETLAWPQEMGDFEGDWDLMRAPLSAEGNAVLQLAVTSHVEIAQMPTKVKQMYLFSLRIK